MASPDPVPALVGPLREQPDRTAVITDFDGTLAPIVVDPPAAHALPGAVEVLHRVAGRYGRVAVVSGRPARFLAARLDVAACPKLVAYGLYGLEWTDGEQVVERVDAGRWRDAVDGTADAAEAMAPEGVWVERKGLSVTLHVRNAPGEGGGPARGPRPGRR